jgi:ATPase subunit of ABC transporter with duplicated ATPase domains
MEKAIKDLRDWALRADNNKFFKRAVSIQKKLDKMDRISKPSFEKQNMKLSFKSAEQSGNETVKAAGLSKSFGEKTIFNEADLLIQYGERVALIGSNGSGKTTFLRMLFKEEDIDDGSVELGASVKLAYLPQNIIFENEELTVLEYFREDISILEGKAREYLSKFMFFGSTVFKKVRHLSGGERIRLKLSKLLYGDINLLILDEPTNHLDIDSIETLEEALEDFKGTIFFISHDRYFINKISERVIAIEDYGFKTYLGNYDYYKSKRAELNQGAIEEPTATKEKVKRIRKIDENKSMEAEAAKAEAIIEALENKIKEIETAMDSSELGYEELNKLYCMKEDLEKELELAMDSWLCLNT